jgi:hypothetical protein
MLTINAASHPFMKRFHKPEDEKRTVVPMRAELFHSWLNATPKTALELLNVYSIPDLTIA